MVLRASGLEEKKMPVTRSQKSYAVKKTSEESSAVSMVKSADATEYASASGATTGGTPGPQPPSEPTTETLSPPLLPPCPIVVAGVTTAVAPTTVVTTALEGSVYESRSSKNGTSHPPSSSRHIDSRARRRELQARLELLERQKEMAKAKALVAIVAAKAKAEEAELKAKLAEDRVAALEEEIKQARVRRRTLARAPQDVTTCQVPPEPAGNVVVSQPVVDVLPCLLLPEPAEEIIASENRREPQRSQPLQIYKEAPVECATTTEQEEFKITEFEDGPACNFIVSATAEPVSVESEGPTSPPPAEVDGALTPSIDTNKDRSLENRRMSVSAIKMVHLPTEFDSPTDSGIDRHALPFLADKLNGIPAGETELLRKVVSNSKCDLAVRRLDLIDKRLTDKYWARWMEKYVRDSQQQGDVMNPAGAYHGDDRGAAHRRRCRDHG
ncbi:hypothetical protein JYU34_002616 [Plutella xylostella]|uniref:Uncharacterized protein n=1 Tax=Plutella xylostella TaxID=51655 RepID=A0ABQ7R2P0_PLUXY|nr:hypothetical protein JYU34_002616 [Plutella xylostella]